ncbi:hypothetical protein LSCM1_02200 [Leishmania martiniquensis]|uniref:N-terminal region of Chorein, a TM vesicle-mediated sorter family protein n=1 Tax=Leishmania martiniquensis TaxID=1580590 RepID=A0A836H1F7_9TRYP|nr:hypothetical protein LSCM1_02200 [Leishmania martiniquensis]
MFDKFVAGLLTSYLGDYFDNIDREQVKVSIWNGLVHMRNLKVRQDALRFVDVPVCVLMGTIEELTIAIPWTRLRSESVVVQIRKAHVVVADKETADYSIDQDTREARERKTRELLATDEALLLAFREGLSRPSSSTAAPASVPPRTLDAADSSDNNFTARLRASILNNIRIEAVELSIHYTSCVAGASSGDDATFGGGVADGALTPQSPQQHLQHSVQSQPSSATQVDAKVMPTSQQVSLSFQINEIKTCGCDERFEPAFVAPGERVARQLISLRGLSALLWVGEGRETQVPFLNPFDVAVELAYQPVYTDMSTPQYMVAARMNGACSCIITSESCITCYGLMQRLVHVRQGQVLRRLRPIGERPKTAPRMWWRYTLDAVRQQIQNSRAVALASVHRPTPFSWIAYTSMKQKRDRYMRLYLRQQRTALGAAGWLEPLTVDEQMAMAALENELAIDVLKLGKRLAIERVEMERAEFEKLLREKRAVAGVGETPTTSPARPSAPPVPLATPLAKGGWFSFWRSGSQAVASASSPASSESSDGLSDEVRAELRELVQLMTADKWTEAQRAVIAQELGMSPEEARALADTQTSLPTPTCDPAAMDSSKKLSSHRDTPSCVVFLHAAALTVELQSSASSAPMSSAVTMREAAASLPARDRLARVALHTLQVGAEWVGVGAASGSTLPAAYYWGAMESFSITAASLSGLEARQCAHEPTEEVILSICRSGIRQDGPQTNSFSPPRSTSGTVDSCTSTADATERQVRGLRSRLRTFSPLEFCWAILPEECRRHAAVQVEWTRRSTQQLTSRTSALHCVRVGLAPVQVVIDVVPLRHLIDFFFTVMGRETGLSCSAVGGRVGTVSLHTSPSVNSGSDGDFTALVMPASSRLTYIEQRCVTDSDARLIVLRRKVERLHSIDWSVAVEAVLVSLSEVPQVQGCELSLTQVLVRNDAEHRLERQERLREEARENQMSGKASPAMTITAFEPLGALDTDWIDCTQVQAAAMRLSVYFPSSAMSGVAPRSIERCVLLSDTAIDAAVERSLLGRCHPNLPQWNLRMSSSDAVSLTWSRTSLSVLTTAGSLLVDLAASLESAILQRDDAYKCTVKSPEGEAVSTFRLRVLPHPTGWRFWHAAPEQQSGSDDDDPPHATSEGDSYYKHLHPFSAARQQSTTTAGVPVPQRVEVRLGVCVVYHAHRSTFPAQYYTLQKGCTHVSVDSGVTDSGVTASTSGATGPRVHLYVSQGGIDHEESLGRDYSDAKSLLLEKLKVPPELLENAVWLQRAVKVWLEKADAENGAGKALSREKVRKALRRAVMGTHAVPCRYVAFQCASSAEACAFAAALRRCCVAETSPPLLLRASVQARYDAAVAAPELRKQPLYGLTFSFPSIRLTCEGSEPSACLDTLEIACDSAGARLCSRRDAVLSLTPFFLRVESYRDNQCYELSVADRVALCACMSSSESHDKDVKLLELSSPSSASSAGTTRQTDGDAGALFVRFVNGRRPSPLPSARWCAMRVGSTAQMRLRVGPAFLEWAEAWWDTVGMLTNRLFSETVIVGYPWWRSFGDDEERQEEEVSEDADVCSSAVANAEVQSWETSEFGGNALTHHVDLSVPSLQVILDVQDAAGAPVLSAGIHMLRFRALGVTLEWRMTEACHHVQVRSETPQLEWCCPSPTGVLPGKANWITLMQPEGAAKPSESEVTSELSLEWKLERRPPMLSLSDWLGARNCGGEDDAAASISITGIRHQQKLKMVLRRVRLLYWHPLVKYLFQFVLEGLVPRTLALVEREPCWFRAGTLLCPPLLWRVPRKAKTAVSWTHICKSVALEAAELQVPRQVDWIAHAVNAALLQPAPHLRLSVTRLLFTDRVQAPVSCSLSDNQSLAMKAVDSAFDVHLFGAVISHAQPGSGTPFQWCLPSLHVNITQPLCDARCFWIAGVPLHRFYRVVLPSPTEPCVMWCSSADLAHAMDVFHANFVASTLLGTEREASHVVNAASPASLLKAVAEESTWTLSVKGEAALGVGPSRSHSNQSGSQPMQWCLLRLSGATASVVRSTGGELRCSFSAQQLWLGCGTLMTGSLAFPESGSSCVLQVEPVQSGGAAAARAASLAVQYGWQWRTNPKVDPMAETDATAPVEKALFLSVDSPGVVTATVNGEAVALLRSTIVDDPHLGESCLRYVAQTPQSVTPSHQLCGDSHSERWATQVVRVHLQRLECRVPCSEELSHSSSPAAAAPLLVLSCAVSRMCLELRKTSNGSHAMMRVSRLLHCALEDSRNGGSVLTSIPLVLEQPTSWQIPVAVPPHPREHASPHAGASSLLSMGAPKPRDATLLDELFGELPAAAATHQTTAVLPTVVDESAAQSRETYPAKDALYAVLEYAPMQHNVIIELPSLWLFAPSMAHMTSMLNGLRAHVKSCAAALLGDNEAPVSLHSTVTVTTALERHGSYALRLRSGTLALFVGESEVAVTATPGHASTVLEAAAWEAVDTQELLLLLTEAVTVMWDSVPPERNSVDGVQTVLRLENTLLCAMQGRQRCKVLLERFSIRVQRQRVQNGASPEASTAPAKESSEEWRLNLDPMQLTLTRLHYTALLRVALQQTSFLAAVMKYSSSASQSIAAASVAPDLSETAAPPGQVRQGAKQVSSPTKARRFLFHLSSLLLRVEADDAADESGPPTAVYFELNEFDAAYYTGRHDWTRVADPEDDLNERGVSLRLAVTLASCLLGTENVIPTLVISAASSRASTQADRASCSLRIAQDEETMAYRGALQVGQITVTLETVPMMAWVDLLYTPYLQETVPDYQTAKEHVMQQDLWLSKDLALSERTPLRVANKLYSLLYLYGNGHTIHMNGARRGRLIFLDEGVTLRIMNAIICMSAPSIEAYVAAGNGSYVVIDRDTCTVVRENDAAAIRGVGVPGGNHPLPAAVELSSMDGRQVASPRWHRFSGEVQFELRIPEPRSVTGVASMLHTGTVHTGITSAQRTLILYSHMNLCLMNTRSSTTGEDELTAAFDLAHVGARSEYVAQQGNAAVDLSSLVSDWAMKVLMTEETKRCSGHGASSPVRTRTFHVSAATGVEVRARYSDAVFMARAARHAQAAASRWQEAVRRDVWSGLSSLQRGWDAPGNGSEASLASYARTPHAGRGDNASALATEAGADITCVAVSVQVPYVSFFIIDDSQDIDMPLFCINANEVHIPECSLKYQDTSAEICFALQLEYYELSQSHWAPVLEPVHVNMSLSSRNNASVVDLYDRKGYLRLSTRTSSVKLCFSSELLRNLRQLLMLRNTFDLARVDALATRGITDGAVTGTSVFYTFKIVQATGVAVVVHLPEHMANPQGVRLRAGAGYDDGTDSSCTRVLHAGQEWEFNLRRMHGKELPREHQKITVQPHHERPSSAPASRACGAVVSLAAVGVQRVPMATSGPLQRYILADVSVPRQRQGQKQVLLHTSVTFTNRLSTALLQIAPNASGGYDTVGVVPPASSQCVPVNMLRRRATFALGNVATISSPSSAPQQIKLSADSILSLGISYDSLPCLAGTVLLCVCSSVHGSRSSASDGRRDSGVGRIAMGKNFEVFSGKPDKTFFLLRVEESRRQPADVLRHPFLSPLRSVIVTAEAVVTIRNAVGVPFMVTLLTRRTQRGRRTGLFDTSPDTAIYTQVHTVAVGVDGSYGVTEMDPLEDVCLSVSLQQPNGVALAQWFAAPAGGSSTAQHQPACVYTPLDKARCDSQLVVADPVTKATLVLAIKYAQREVVLYCPQWIFNETSVPLQLADTTRPHHGDTGRCVAPLAGLSGLTVSTATVAPWEADVGGSGHCPVGRRAEPFLYNSLTAEWGRKNRRNEAGSHGLFLRLWETADAGMSRGGSQASWSDWSSKPLQVHEAAEAQVIVCVSRHKRGALWVLSCLVEMGHQASVGAYSDTRVVTIRPRWVLVNKSPYTMRFAQYSSSGGNGSLLPATQTGPFTEAVVNTLVASEVVGGRLQPLFSFMICDDGAHNVDQCHWSPPFEVHAVGERYVNLVYQARVPLAQHWPQAPPGAPNENAQGVADCLPPLRPEDIQEIDGELFVRREEAKVFNITTFVHKGCMMCVQVEEAVQPPLVLENRTSFTVCFRQRGARRVSTVFPRRRKAWTWDVPPAAGQLPAEVELWVLLNDVGRSTASGPKTTPAASARCVLNFDPQQIGHRPNSVGAFQRELEVVDAATGASSLLFVRVRGVHGISYAVSITTEPTIDAYRTLPFPQLSFTLHLASMYVLCRATGKAEGWLRDILLLAIEPVDFSFLQGARVPSDTSRPAPAGPRKDAEGCDVQRIQLRFRSFQVDDERLSAKQRVVAQLVDDRESGLQIERKLLRVTPILCCSVVALRLTPVELHIEDGFITAMMRYAEEVKAGWETLWPSRASRCLNAPGPDQGRQALLLPWQVDLERRLTAAKQLFLETQGGSTRVSQQRSQFAVPLGCRVVAIQQLVIDPLLVSLSLYRTPGAMDDPLWKLAGAASLLIGSTQDARLQWDAVQQSSVCDTIWHLIFLYRESYVKQTKKQYMSLVNIMGLDTVRSFVSDLLNAYSDTPADRRDGLWAGRRQKQRVPCRRAAHLLLDHGTSGSRSIPGGTATFLQHPSAALFPAGYAPDDRREAKEAASAITSWLPRVPERVVQLSSQRTATVAEVARGCAWDDFMAVARAPEIRAFGGGALARALAEMRGTPRYSLRSTGGGGRRPRASEVVRGAASNSIPRVACRRCVELEALREARWRNRESTPLPHPVHEGFITWEEFAHHINWYEFVDMCSDEEVRAYASLVLQGASEASCNVCILTNL